MPKAAQAQPPIGGREPFRGGPARGTVPKPTIGGPEDIVIAPPGNRNIPIGRRIGGFPGVVNRQGGGSGTNITNPFRQNQIPGGTK